MPCPFLRESLVRSCHAAALRKLIPLGQGGLQGEKCSNGEYAACAAFKEQEGAAAATAGLCPYLYEAPMQSCSGSPVTRFVPYSEASNSRCGTGGYRFCDLYLTLAHPGFPKGGEEVFVPGERLYSGNHMWLDVSDDGICHAGIDGLLARALGIAESVSYLWQTGRRRPAALVTAGGRCFDIAFPRPFLLTGCNLRLRAEPSRLTEDPYAGGWLFEGRVDAGTTRELLPASVARQKIEEEQHRIGEILQMHLATPGACSADGGWFREGILASGEDEQARAIFHEFFSPWAALPEEAITA
jgi:glycine cleavage system H lipoate-binding protein